MSLLPSATEIVYALDLGDDLVGVTFECDEPPQARTDKTVVVGGRDTRGMTPNEIDEYVTRQLADGGDLYTLHADALADLRPELILTQDLCRVCAVPSGSVSDALDYLGCRADVLSLDPMTLDEVLDTILEVGARAGAAARAEAIVVRLQARLDAVAARVAGHVRPRVAVLEWVDPPFTAGHWIPDLVRAAGGEPVAARPGARAVQTSWRRVRRRGARGGARRAVRVSPRRCHPAGSRRRSSLPGCAGMGHRRRRHRRPARTEAGRWRRGDRVDPASRCRVRSAQWCHRPSGMTSLVVAVAEEWRHP